MRRQKIQNDINKVLEDKTSTPKDRKRSIFYELRDNPSLPASEKSVKRFEDEATLLVMAGKQIKTCTSDF